MGVLWRKSQQVEFDKNGERAIACEAQFYQGGTTTPFVVYHDAAETTPHTSPVEADGTGRWPDVFVPFCASYDEKITTDGGTQLSYTRQIPNPDPVTAAEASVDATTLLQTGMMVFYPKTGTLTGFVRANGRTIGSASSGASERANADTSALYAFLWNSFADAILPVTGGRGGSAAADFVANKPIAIFDGRAAGLVGLDDMGNTAASALATAPFTTGAATTGGSVCGANTHVLTSGELGAHTHTFTIASSGAHTHTGTSDNQSNDHTHTGTTGGHSADHTHSGTTSGQSADHSHTGTTSTDGAHTHTGSTDGDTPSHVHDSGSRLAGKNGGATLGAGAGNTWFGDAGEITTGGPNAPHAHGFTTGSAGSHNHTMTTGGVSVDHSHTVTTGGVSVDHTHNFTSNGANAGHTHTFTIASSGAHTHTGTSDSTGSSTAHNIVAKSILGTWLVKL